MESDPQTNYCIQFLVGFLATASGVVLAILLQKWHERSKKKKETKEIIEKIKGELKDAIHTIKTTRKSKNDLFLSPIKTPVFKAYVDSTKITLLDKWYDDLLILYKYIDDFNAWHNLKTEKSFDEKNNVSLKKIDDCIQEVENLIMQFDIIKELGKKENVESKKQK